MDSPFTSPLRVRGWPDAVVDRLGYEPTSEYFEWLWLPRIGPSCAWAYRRMIAGLLSQPQGYSIRLDELAHWLGLGGTGQHSPLLRSLRRLEQFGLAVRIDEHTIRVRRKLPPLTQAQLRRLSPVLQAIHLRLVHTSGSGDQLDRTAG